MVLFEIEMVLLVKLSQTKKISNIISLNIHFRHKLKKIIDRKCSFVSAEIIDVEFMFPF